MEKFRFVVHRFGYANVDVEAESLKEARRTMGRIIHASENNPVLDAIYDAITKYLAPVVSFDYTGPSNEFGPDAHVTINSACEIVR